MHGVVLEVVAMMTTAAETGGRRHQWPPNVNGGAAVTKVVVCVLQWFVYQAQNTNNQFIGSSNQGCQAYYSSIFKANFQITNN